MLFLTIGQKWYIQLAAIQKKKKVNPTEKTLVYTAQEKVASFLQGLP